MTDLFDRAAAQALGLGMVLRPRARSRFEPDAPTASTPFESETAFTQSSLEPAEIEQSATHPDAEQPDAFAPPGLRAADRARRDDRRAASAGGPPPGIAPAAQMRDASAGLARQASGGSPQIMLSGIEQAGTPATERAKIATPVKAASPLAATADRPDGAPTLTQADPLAAALPGTALPQARNAPLPHAPPVNDDPRRMPARLAVPTNQTRAANPATLPEHPPASFSASVPGRNSVQPAVGDRRAMSDRVVEGGTGRAPTESSANFAITATRQASSTPFSIPATTPARATPSQPGRMPDAALAPPSAPSIEITIGRLEIRAEAAPGRPVKSFSPHLDLAAYQARRERGR